MSKGETKVQSAEGVKKTHRRRKKRLKIIIPVVLVLAALIGVKAFSSYAPAAIPVYTDQVSTGDIDTVLSVSGKVIAEESVTFFAPASAKVEGIEVSKGDVVKAGDVLLCFDEDAVAYAKQQTELAEKISTVVDGYHSKCEEAMDADINQWIMEQIDSHTGEMSAEEEYWCKMNVLVAIDAVDGQSLKNMSDLAVSEWTYDT